MDTFCIPIKVTDEEDLYDGFCPSGLAFSGELVAYLEDYLIDRRIGENVCLELQAAQPPDMARFRDACHAYLEKLTQRNKRAIRQSDLRALAALLLGVVFISLGYTFSGRVDSITAEIISAVGSFSLWAAIAIYLETLPTLRYKEKILKVFSKAEIRYRDTSTPADPQ